MVLQEVTSAAYLLVESSWTAATFLIWPILLANLALAYREDALTLEGVQDTFIEYSRDSVAMIVLGGVLIAVTGTSISAPLLLWGQLAALGYFIFLFWKF